MGYFIFLDGLVASARSHGQDLAVFVPTYSLAPSAAYPTQLTQSVEALRYILEHTGRAPAQVLLGGDSAGGNLAMGVLSHLAHTHPAIEPLKVNEPLAGVVAIAPWTLIGEDHSARLAGIYSGGDLITPEVDGPWAGAFLGGAPKDYYTSASAAPPSWLGAFPVAQVLICGGGSEIMLPAIEDFAEKLQVIIAAFFLTLFVPLSLAPHRSSSVTRIVFWDCIFTPPPHTNSCVLLFLRSTTRTFADNAAKGCTSQCRVLRWASRRPCCAGV